MSVRSAFSRVVKSLRSFFMPEDTPALSKRSSRYLRVLSTVIFTTTVVCLLAAACYMTSAYSLLYTDRHKGVNEMLLEAFSDFTYIMQMSLRANPWAVGASSYPPLAILILKPFALICRDALSITESRHVSSYKACALILREPTFWVSLVLFTVLCAAAVFLLLQTLMKFRGNDYFRLFLALVFSAPFTYVIIRGNILFVGLIFTLMFLCWYESDNPVLREIALISLALAGAIKIYPLFFGVFLLRKKKWFASCRVALYTVLFFLIPLYVIYPHPDAPIQFVRFTRNLGAFASRENRLAAFNNLSVGSIIYKILSLFVKDLSPSDLLYRIPNYAAMAVLFVTATAGSLMTSNRFTRLTLCFATVVLIPSVSYFYILAFAALPFCEFLRVYDELPTGERIFHALGYGYLFFIPALAGMFYLPQALIVLTMFILASKNAFREGASLLRAKRAAEAVPSENH